MKFATHAIDKNQVGINQIVEANGVVEAKVAANKGLYNCPYCAVNLKIASGPQREAYFAHPKNLSCEKSESVDKNQKKYEQQKSKESVRQPLLVSVFYDEIKTASKNESSVHVYYGYEELALKKYFPDLVVQIGYNKWAVNIVTNVKSREDEGSSKQFKKQDDYFKQNGLLPIWFVDSKNYSGESDKNSIILWETEWIASISTIQDKAWEIFLSELTSHSELFQLFNYPASNKQEDFAVKSIFYISQDDGKNMIQVKRYIDDKRTKPYRGFLLGEVYSISLSQALHTQEGAFQLSDQEKEVELQNELREKLGELRKEAIERGKKSVLESQANSVEEISDEEFEKQRQQFMEQAAKRPIQYSEAQWRKMQSKGYR